jgi:hypothetical protein
MATTGSLPPDWKPPADENFRTAIPGRTPQASGDWGERPPPRIALRGGVPNCLEGASGVAHRTRFRGGGPMLPMVIGSIPTPSGG